MSDRVSCEKWRYVSSLFRTELALDVMLDDVKSSEIRENTIKHVDEVLKMMKALTGNESFEEILNNPEIKEGGVSNMCEVMDRIEARAEARGIEQGLGQGLLQGKVSALYYDAGWNIQQIAVQLNLSAEQVKEILK